MKLYKLCYFSQGWHLAWTGKPLFSDEFEGWRHGPVSQKLRHHTEEVAKGYTVAEVPGGESAHTKLPSSGASWSFTATRNPPTYQS